MFLLSRDRVITYKGASLVINDEMMQKVADLLGVSIEIIRNATEKYFPQITINKSNSSVTSLNVDNTKSSQGLQERLKQLTKGK